MQRADRIRLQHMQEAAQTAVTLMRGRSRKDLDNDIGLVLAEMKAIEIVGEAASKVSPEFMDTHDAIPWAEIVGMRNRLVHVYFDINRDLLLETVQDDLPPLIDLLAAILQQEQDASA